MNYLKLNFVTSARFDKLQIGTIVQPAIMRQDDESVFPIEIIKQKISSHSMIAGLRRVDFHVEKNSNYDAQELSKEIDNFLCSKIPGLDRVSVNIFFRENITDRRIMFGDLNNNDFKLRWVLSSTHFPRPKVDDPRPIPTAYSDSQVLALLSEKDSSACYSRYYAQSPSYSRISTSHT